MAPFGQGASRLQYLGSNVKGVLAMTAAVFTGSDIDRFRAIVLRSALKLYRDTGIRANRAYTPTAMLATTGQLTGRTFKRGQYSEAIEALTEILGEK